MFFLQFRSNLCTLLLGTIVEQLQLSEKDHAQKFGNYKPNVFDNFQKPQNAGWKPNYAKKMRTSPDLDIAMDRVEEVYPSTNNSSSQPIESIIYDFKFTESVHRKNLHSSSVNISPKIWQNAKEGAAKVLTKKMEWSFALMVRVTGK